MMAGSRLRSAALGLTSLLLVALTARSLRSRPSAEAAMEVPSAVEMDSLSRYLAPAAPAPRLDDAAVFLAAPTRVAATALPVGAPGPVDPDPSVWKLSAILIGGPRPIAIIDDQPVTAGGELADGSRVLSIERDHVVIQAPNGARRRLSLTAG